MSMAGVTLALPRLMAIKSHDKGDYLGYIHDHSNQEANGYLTFTQTQVPTVYSQFEVERGGKDGTVHIRSRRNNKYWVRTQNPSITGKQEEENWITATAPEKEDDRTKDSCTLFKPIQVDPDKKTVRFVHVQSGCYLCLWRVDKEPFTRSVLANYKSYDSHSCDIFTVVDWDSLLILPKYVAFKGDNDGYLRRRVIEGNPYLQFDGDDIGDSTVVQEIFTVEDGIIRIKNVSGGRFWRRSPTWILVDSDDSGSGDKDTLFLPFKVDSRTIGLLSMGNGYFCKRLTGAGRTSCLNAAVTSITREVRLIVEEPVVSRTVYDVDYDLDNARIYDQTLVILSKNSAANHGHQPSSLDVKLSYTDTKTRTWHSMLSLNLKAATSMSFGVAEIAEGSIKMSADFESKVEWGNTNTITTVLEVVHTVVVPAMTRVTVNLVATKGTCDVPFTLMQKDTLYTGKTVSSEVHGTYVGSNYYYTGFETTEEKLKA